MEIVLIRNTHEIKYEKELYPKLWKKNKSKNRSENERNSPDEESSSDEIGFDQIMDLLEIINPEAADKLKEYKRRCCSLEYCCSLECCCCCSGTTVSRISFM